MTHNFNDHRSAAKWLDDANQPALTPERQRAAPAGRRIDETIITGVLSQQADGTPIKYRSDVKTGLIFARHGTRRTGEGIRSILLMQEENLRPMSMGALGRWFPSRQRASRARSGG